MTFLDSFDQACAVLSAAAYRYRRDQANFVEPPTGAVRVAYEQIGGLDGFEASAFTYDGKVVIAFAGTNPVMKSWDFAADSITNLNLFLGNLESQLEAAAEFYQRIKNDSLYQGKEIVFTGHSLGGGLAGLMGVFFNEPAITFDPAPFRLAATEAMASAIQEHLLGKNPAWVDAALDSFYAVEGLLALEAPDLAAALAVLAGTNPLLLAQVATKVFPVTIRGETGIRTYSVEGEFLTSGFGLAAEYLNLLRIQSGSAPINIDISSEGSTLGAMDLHSIALLIAGARVPQFAQLVEENPILAAALFDKSLYARSANEDATDFLVALVQDEFAGAPSAEGTGHIQKFTADLQKLFGAADGMVAQDGIRRALTVAAMEYHYFNGAASTEVFTSGGDGLHAAIGEIGDVDGDLRSPALLIEALRPYLSEAEWSAVGGVLGDAQAWHVQAGTNGMVWTGTGSSADVALGGAQTDVLDGGGGDDLLIGGAGQDFLTGSGGADTLIGGVGNDAIDGGEGTDYLHGGAGNDTYTFSGSFGGDWIIDSDGLGTIKVNGTTLAGGKKVAGTDGFYRDVATGWSYTLAGKDLILRLDGSPNQIRIRDWQPGQLGITLDQTEISLTQENVFIGDFAKKTNPNGTQYVIADGNYVSDGVQADAHDVITGTASKDKIEGRGGNDALVGLAGDDYIDGGEGVDILQGGLGADTLIGGGGRDAIYGSSNGSLVYPTSTSYTPPGASHGILIGQGFSWVYDASGRDAEGFLDGWITNVNRDQQAGDAGNVIDGGAGEDFVAAGTGDDWVLGGDDADDIYGMGGSDALDGEDGNDRIYGDGPSQNGTGLVIYAAAADHGSDVIDGGAGNDILLGQGNDDLLRGGAGNDTLWGDDRDTGDTPAQVHGRDYLDGGDNDDEMIGGGRGDELFGGAGADRMWGDAGAVGANSAAYLATEYHGNDYLDGEAGDDYLQGEGGSDRLFGGADNDVLVGDGDQTTTPIAVHGDDYLDGEEGDDQLAGGGGDDDLFGGIGADVLLGDDSETNVAVSAHGADYLDGGAGEDTLVGGGGNDDLFGGADNDYLDGDADHASVSASGHGNDHLDGEGGDDVLVGRGGSDTLFGGVGDDELQGDASTDGTPAEFHGADYLDGGDGTDLLIGGGGADTLFGGVGNDELQGDASNESTPAVSHGADYLDGEEGNDLLFGGGGDDTLFGGADNDQLQGDSADTPAEFHGADYLDGEAGNDTLFGYGGDDTLVGGDGADWLAGEDEIGSGAVSALSGNDQLFGGAGDDTLIGGNGNDSLEGGDDNDRLYGGAGNDTLVGGAGNDFLRPGEGADVMRGGLGDDIYYFALGSGVKRIEDASGFNLLVLEGGIHLSMLRLSLGSLAINIGDDEIHLDGVDYNDLAGTSPIAQIQFDGGQTMSVADVIAALGIELPATPDADVITGTSGRDNIDALDGDDQIFAGGGDDVVALGAGADTADGGDGNDAIDAGDGADLVTGGLGNDTLRGGEGDDTLMAGAGADVVDGGSGADTLDGGEGDDLLNGEAGVDLLEGGAGDDTLFGGADADALTGGAGSDLLDGGTGADVMAGGADDDTYYVDEAGDQVVEAADEGHDVVHSAISMVLGENVEVLLLEADAAAVDGTGNALDNILVGNANDNSLAGMDGADSLAGGAGNDTLDGGAGADEMHGGEGDDLYIVDVTEDVVTELAGEGHDTVVAAADYTLGDGVEDLVLTGDAVAGTGNALGNVVIGSGLDNYLDGGAGDDLLEAGDGNDVLLGGEGIDTMIGGAGDDFYEVDHADDQVVEQAGEGFDGVQSFDSYTLGAHLEGLILAGENAIDATGNELDNYLIGNLASNVLDGRAGNDTMEGGQGDDTYVIDSGDDQVIEWAGEGNDTVVVGFSYTAGNNIENIRLVGDADLDATGDEGDNVLEGNAGNNVLDGGAGADLLAGGAGNDTYFVDNEQDAVYEYWDEGIDTIVRAVEDQGMLSDGVEHLVLTGAAVTGIGNDLDNEIAGNDADNTLVGYSGDDTLLGGAGSDTLFGFDGADSMVGGAGDDFYVVDDAGDVIVEASGEGDDFVQSSVDITLGANVERVALDGWDDLSAVGNALDNGLWGNAGNNTLTGGQGDDFLSGGEGDDVYVFNLGDGDDSVDNTDFVGSFDTLRFGAGITENDVLAMAYGNHLFFRIKGTNDEIGFIDYYAGVMDEGNGPQDHMIDAVEFDNGVVWDQAMIQTVVDRALYNQYPTVNYNLPTLTARAGSAFSYTVPANVITDPDAWDSVTYSITMPNGSPVPAWLEFDPATRVISGTPASGDIGTLGIVLWGTDNYNASAGFYVTINVGAPNSPPVVNTPLADRTANQGTPLSFMLPGTSFTDPNGDPLTYTATLADGSPLPGWLVFNPATRSFTGTPATLGTLSVRVTATDTSNAAVSDIFDIVVSVQNLVLTGTSGADTLTGGAGNDSLSGSGGNDRLLGHAGNDTLNGGTGLDTMTGGSGNDSYSVDNTGDVVVELADEGTDLVSSSVTYTLSANVENLTLTGSSGIGGTGNALDNVLTGNSGTNVLAGGAGNDTYVVTSGDTTTEAAGAGIDTVLSASTWTLAANVENLTLTGSSAVNGTGNTLNNVLTGNGAANTLTGNAGADTLDGRGGADNLVGGAGNDTYLVARGYGGDTVQENDATAGNADELRFLGDIAADQIWLRQVGNNLEVSVIGSSDSATLVNWYAGAQYRVETLTAGDGKVLLAGEVQNLVSAMAAFAPPAAGETTLPPAYQSALGGVIAANWS